MCIRAYEIKFLFILAISLLSSLAFSYEIPDIVKRDPKTIFWNWTTFGADFQKKTTISADYTNLAKINDNFIFIPVILFEYQTNKTSEALLRTHQFKSILNRFIINFHR